MMKSIFQFSQKMERQPNQLIKSLIPQCCTYTLHVAHYYFHHFQPLRLYSSSSSIQIPKSPNTSYTNYLVHNLGFSNQQANSIYTKLRYKIDDAYFSKFSGNAHSVIAFLKQHGFEDTHIKKAVSSYPQILSADVNQTLIPKFQVFKDHGFSESDLVSLISSSPVIVSKRVDPIIRDLRAILDTNDNIIKFLRNNILFMGPSTLANLNSNIASLNKEYGLAINDIRNAILRFPAPYSRDTEFFQNIVVRVERELGIPRTSGMFTYGIRLLCHLSKKAIESKCEVLKSFGWTQYDVSELMRINPATFQLSEENIRKKLGFLMTELDYKPDFLAKHFRFFSSSLENVLLPRHRVLLFLKEKGLLDYNFYTAIKKTEKEFLKIFIEPFKEDAPRLLELYQSSKGNSNIDALS